MSYSLHLFYQCGGVGACCVDRGLSRFSTLLIPLCEYIYDRARSYEYDPYEHQVHVPYTLQAETILQCILPSTIHKTLTRSHDEEDDQAMYPTP